MTSVSLRLEPSPPPLRAVSQRCAAAGLATELVDERTKITTLEHVDVLGHELTHVPFDTIVGAGPLHACGNASSGPLQGAVDRDHADTEQLGDLGRSPTE